ncbi:MAG: ATP-dependent RNA helicase HrpA, partial [Planctomycetales bacterium]|nr:ATP-dependent RNA helicase HrpA [Planctomycetales bacterium]
QPAPIVEVSGRGYPVDVRYRPLEQDEDGDDVNLPRGIADAASELAAEGPGDMLVFLPTERDIRDVSKVLRGRTLGGGAEIVPLYARLSTQEQNKVFQPHKGRRIVLATNVAESSLTVPNIRYVIDSGLARISRYSPRSKVQRLPIEPISQASADQRMGRCGRVGPGICVRLFAEDDYQARDRYPTPEIRRTNLAAVILQMLALRLGSIDEFPFLDPPRHESVRDGFKTLYELGAIDEHRRLTDVGRRLSQLPVDPRIGRMILAAEGEQCLHEVLIIAAALETQDPRERPVDKQAAADEKHGQWAHPDSDFLSLLNLWDFYHKLKDELSRNQLQKACRQNFLSSNRMREWLDVHRQLVRLVTQANLKIPPRRDDYDAIHRSLLAGLLSNIAMRVDRFEYQGAGSQRFQLWPGSSLFKNKPSWLIAAELLETSRRYLRTAARINPDWIEPLAGHLVKRSYSQPHWSKRRRSVMAYERVTLFGLPIVAQRQVRYGPHDPVEARRIFIQNALVEGLFDAKAAFYEQNRALLKRLREEGNRARRADLFVSDQALYEFYHERLPDNIYDWATLRRWLDTAAPDEIERLAMRRSDVLPQADDEVELEFPDRYDLGDLSVQVEYRFQPGETDDGLTLTIPREAVSRLDADRLDWLVPGMLEEKITALIRTLPKSIRRSLVPAPDTARQAAGMLHFGQGPFLQTVAQTLSRLAEEPIGVEAFELDKLPAHLRFNVRVIDANGKLLARGRDLNSLRAELHIEAEQSDEGVIADARWERDEIVAWDFGELPQRVPVKRGAFALPAFPTLIDRGRSVSLRLVDSLSLAERRARAGVRRLFAIAEHRELRAHVVWLPRWDEMQRFAMTLPHQRTLAEQVMDLLADLALRQVPLPRDADQFAAACKQARKQLSYAVQEAAGVLPKIFETYQAARLALDELRGVEKLKSATDDIERQLGELLAEGFLAETPWQWLVHVPRYLQAILIRIDRLRSGGQARDAQALAELRVHLDRFRQRAQELATQNEDDPALDEYRWLIEEYRVSLFAQQLGTSTKVSSQRLEKHWRTLA